MSEQHRAAISLDSDNDASQGVSETEGFTKRREAMTTLLGIAGLGAIIYGIWTRSGGEVAAGAASLGLATGIKLDLHQVTEPVRPDSAVAQEIPRASARTVMGDPSLPVQSMVIGGNR